MAQIFWKERIRGIFCGFSVQQLGVCIQRAKSVSGNADIYNTAVHGQELCVHPARQGRSGSSRLSVLQQFSHICSTSVLNSAAHWQLPVWNLPQQQQGWHQPYSPPAERLRTVKTVQTRRTGFQRSSGDADWDQIHLHCVSASSRDEEGWICIWCPSTCLKETLFLNLPYTDSSLIIGVKRHWHCSNTSYF